MIDFKIIHLIIFIVINNVTWCQTNNEDLFGENTRETVYIRLLELGDGNLLSSIDSLSRTRSEVPKYGLEHYYYPDSLTLISINYNKNKISEIFIKHLNEIVLHVKTSRHQLLVKENFYMEQIYEFKYKRNLKLKWLKFNNKEMDCLVDFEAIKCICIDKKKQKQKYALEKEAIVNLQKKFDEYNITGL